MSVTTLVRRARRTDIVTFSQLRWRSVYQRPHHLMSRAATEGRVYWVEEPDIAATPGISMERITDGLTVVVPQIPDSEGPHSAATVTRLLGEVLAAERVDSPILWYYTPIALRWTRGVEPVAVVYDCMDQLSAFANASAQLPILETKLLTQADLVFTGGASLHEAKRDLARNVHLFPSSVDAGHFRAARRPTREPYDQRAIRSPRIGYAGVIDERMDLELVAGLAAERPDWSFVLLGPVAKIDETALPRARNIHYLGQKSYEALPLYMAGWDAGILPFALNEATRFISPTKVPEYLAAGLPVVSTPIRDVIRPYQGLGLARIARTADAFASALDAALAEDTNTRIAAADRFLARTSWNRTWRAMAELLDAVVEPRLRPAVVRRAATSAIAAEAS